MDGAKRDSNSLSRRTALQLAGAALAAMPYRLRGAEPVVSPLMMTLSNYMADAARRTLPDAVAEKTRHIILDTLAAMVSGATLPPGKFAIQFAGLYKGAGVSTVVASDILCGPIEAAMCNAMLAHSDETDDTHPPSQSHPGASVVPSALAAGEKFGIDGTRFLRSVALGYDIGPRVTITLGKLQYMVETHRSTHALSGSFGSAAGRCLRSGPQRAANALGAVLYGAGSGRAGFLAARHGPHREIIRLWRNAGAQRSHGCFTGAGRCYRRRRYSCRSR